MKRITALCTALTASALAVGSASAASVDLFTDTFDDELGGPNATTNASVSGVFAQTEADNYLLRESNSATPAFGETGGNATVNASAGGNSAMLLSLADLATNADIITSGVLTISLTGVDNSGDFIAFNLVKADPGNPSGNTTFIATSNTLLGVLFRVGGNPQVFDQGTKVFDSAIAPAYTDGGDVTIELSNMTGLGTAAGSFDYDILDDGVSVDSGTVAGDLSSLFFGIESRANGASTVDSLSITTVPEPGSLALLGLGGLLIARRRRD